MSNKYGTLQKVPGVVLGVKDTKYCIRENLEKNTLYVKALSFSQQNVFANLLLCLLEYILTNPCFFCVH